MADDTNAQSNAGDFRADMNTLSKSKIIAKACDTTL